MNGTKAYIPVPLPDYRELPLETMRENARAFHAELRARHTVRDFSSRPVPRDIIETCILAAGTAPNGANHQPWHFAVIGDAAIKKRIREAAEIEEAPWLICIFGERRSRSADGVLRKNYYVPESVSIACGFLIAALHRAGLVMLTHTPNPMGFLNEICGRDPHDKPYILMVVGYPKDGATIPAHALEKKPLDQIATFL